MLCDASSGDELAAAALMPLVYDELRRLAEHYMGYRGRSDTLQPTALVHEAFVKLVDHATLDVNSRTHFFAIAANAMRFVLADQARRRLSAKRGGGWARVTLSDASDQPEDDDEFDAVGLHDALTKLADQDERAARIVELRFFGGLTIDQTATVLRVSSGTVKNEFRWVRAWLLAELSDDQ